jgi:metal-sulfur cluster biosynthetic enzyme
MKYAKLKERIIEKLKEIYDPEIPVNLYDLGLIYAIDCAREGNSPTCVVTMTLTSATCPVSDSLLDQVRNIGSLIEEEPDLKIEPNLVFDPPWTQDKISIEAKLELGML